MNKFFDLLYLPNLNQDKISNLNGLITPSGSSHWMSPNQRQTDSAQKKEEVRVSMPVFLKTFCSRNRRNTALRVHGCPDTSTTTSSKILLEIFLSHIALSGLFFFNLRASYLYIIVSTFVFCGIPVSSSVCISLPACSSCAFSFIFFLCVCLFCPIPDCLFLSYLFF